MTIIPFEELRVSATAVLFEGGDDLGVSIFVTEYERGRGVQLHLHPYAEIFVVHAGTGTFTVGGSDQEVTAGHVVIVPANTPHGFRGAGDDTLRVVSVHPSGEVVQTDLAVR